LLDIRDVALEQEDALLEDRDLAHEIQPHVFHNELWVIVGRRVRHARERHLDVVLGGMKLKSQAQPHTSVHSTMASNTVDSVDAP
jgi:hypothetical protein